MKKSIIRSSINSKKIIFVISVILIGVFVLTGCASKSKETTTKSSNGKKVVELKMPSQTGFNSIDVAIAKGYFDEEGIVIKYTGTLQAGTSAAQTVIAGLNDVFTAHPSVIAKAVLAGAKLKIVSPGIVDNANFVHMDYMVRKDGPIQSAADVKNRKVKVAVSGTGSCNDLIALEWARKNGIPAENLEFVLMPEAQQQQAVTQGLVDIANLHPVSYKKAHEDGELKTLFTSWEVVGTPASGSSAYGFSEKFMKENPETVKGFIRANNKANKFINSNQKEAIEIVAKALDKKTEDITTFWYDETPEIQESYVQVWLDLMLTHKQLTEDQYKKIKATDIYTNEYNPLIKN